MTPIYHITHLANLPSIIADGGLHCDRVAGAKSGVTDIGHSHIKRRRAQRQVCTTYGDPVAASGRLDDYVPFYFGPRSPMLYVISRGGVEQYAGGQREVVYLVSSAEAASALGRSWCFTDGHAEMAYSEYYGDLADLGEIDWAVINARNWSDSGETRRKRQAEFLVHAFFPWTAIEAIATYDQTAKSQVEHALTPTGHRPPVQARRAWYY